MRTINQILQGLYGQWDFSNDRLIHTSSLRDAQALYMLGHTHNTITFVAYNPRPGLRQVGRLLKGIDYLVNNEDLLLQMQVRDQRIEIILLPSFEPNPKSINTTGEMDMIIRTHGLFHRRGYFMGFELRFK